MIQTQMDGSDDVQEIDFDSIVRKVIAQSNNAPKTINKVESEGHIDQRLVCLENRFIERQSC